ncbi:putative arginine metabolism regulation II [Clavispora lusitaniae]|uniref:Arginine metabolism regulation II n=1 Tax=Clavispora lusitaniae TaxID=36911 RepID=A0ACD0WRX4_CLALS|nr:putative arginine metabolism regulation II [Clavispora lusitaniae]QFZ35417.1 putative arginine metabolism regulation II [Clavispora lusitaniae]QFZ41111.1 putative arginine metabolism regulation II [Clavispora lusitaniae]QFZ46792.1 putative arginine metabolism regulation II [Clavispora lusitaniae]QFZ52457.1 putative arginine metabolism regulation II [Clavispora lusitaniae]
MVSRKSKTFTGCFTCRSRKIRCDLHRPQCLNCRKSDLTCSGYDIKLCWSLPVKFTPNGRNPIQGRVVFPKEDKRASFFQRRRVSFVVWEKAYETYDDMDHDLNMLRPGPGTTFQGPFGVFRQERNSLENDALRAKTAPTSSQSPAEQTSVAPKASPNGTAALQPGHNVGLANLELEQNFSGELWLSTELREHALLTAAALNGDPQFLDFAPPDEQTDLLDLVFHRRQEHASGPSSFAFAEPLEIQLHAAPHDRDGARMPEALMEIVRRPPDLAFDVSHPNGLPVPTTAFHVQPLTRYLLHYYVNHVADLMTVLPLTDNPWKSIYFPRALSAIGELAALGQTSAAKNALLNALLAVAAFNLQSKFAKGSPQMRFYLDLGIRLRNQASLFVKALLGPNDSAAGVARCVAQEKYKDVLCAVMSMISVDLVWGTMQDTAFYLDWCGKVIRAKMAHKKKLSPKARLLHRIFASMRLIQDSTSLDVDNDHGSEEFLDGPFGLLEKGRIDYIVDATPLFVDKKLVNADKHDERFATAALNGLPSSLLALFGDTVRLRREMMRQNASPAFADKISQLQSRMDHWTLDWKLFDDQKRFPSPMHEATYLHIMSFYHALVIYFRRLIQQVPPSEIQDKVRQTLEHLNSLQKLIAADEAHIIPLFWQGFIAGCEATSEELQAGFKQWGADIAQYLGSYWGARQIMLEVWRRKRLHEAGADWVSVIRDWEMNLMLN